MSDVRGIDGKLYVITHKYFPYADDGVNTKGILPKAVLVERDGDGFKVVRKKANCNEIDFLIPNDDTITKGYYQPSINTITTINTHDDNKVMNQSVILGNQDSLYMSHKALYLLAPLYLNNYRCEADFCMMPRFDNVNTLLYKYKLDKGKGEIAYDHFTLLNGSPLSQYSMNEDESENFSIITQDNKKKQGVYIYMLDKDGSLLSKLENIGKGERFKSSRYMGDRLFLVTFKDIDPFFVVDMSDPKNINVEGELKIPGYSTYLHPYDKDHLIGIGKEVTNEREGGIKVDVYDISDFHSPKQAQSYVVGKGNFVQSEVLMNPRMFMFKDNVLVFPYEMYGEKGNEFEQKSVILHVSPKGIQKIGSDTHYTEEHLRDSCRDIIEEIKKEPVEKVCKKTITGEEVCVPVRVKHLPGYCLAGSNDRYYRDSSLFIKRNLIIGDEVFSFSDRALTKQTIKND